MIYHGGPVITDAGLRSHQQRLPSPTQYSSCQGGPVPFRFSTIRRIPSRTISLLDFSETRGRTPVIVPLGSRMQASRLVQAQLFRADLPINHPTLRL